MPTVSVINLGQDMFCPNQSRINGTECNNVSTKCRFQQML